MLSIISGEVNEDDPIKVIENGIKILDRRSREHRPLAADF